MNSIYSAAVFVNGCCIKGVMDTGSGNEGSYGRETGEGVMERMNLRGRKSER
jgi:hypothetical protein